LQIVRDQGVAGVAEEVIKIAQAGRQPARGVGVASRKDQLGILKPEPLGGLANDAGSFAVDQFNGGEPQRLLGEVAVNAVDRGAVEVAAQLVVATDQPGDGIAHEWKWIDAPAAEVSTCNRQDSCPLVGSGRFDRNGYAAGLALRAERRAVEARTGQRAQRWLCWVPAQPSKDSFGRNSYKLSSVSLRTVWP